MQYWLTFRKSAQTAALFALVSLVLTACTAPVKTNQVATPITATQSSKKPNVVTSFFGETVTNDTQAAENDPSYYDTTGVVASQDDIDELLGVTEMEAAVLSPEDLAKFGDVWERTRAGFKLEATDNERIAAQRAWFGKRQDYLDRMTARASHYLYHTVTEAEKLGIPTELALLPIIESSYDPFATSPAQAAGLWQFIPGTGKIYGLRQTWWYDGRRDVLESTRAAYKFLTQLYNKFGSWELALASYNWGPGNVQKAIDRNLAAGLPTDYWSLRMPAETMAYVPRFLAVAQIVKDPTAFGVRLKPIVNKPHFRETYAKNQVDLSAVAKIAGLTTKQLYQLNPAYMRWATNPDGPHRILVPTETNEVFEELLAGLPAPERYITVTKRYVVKKGDNIYRIAAKFDTTPANLKRLNGSLINKKGRVAVGKSLVIAKVRTLVSGENVASEQLVNPAVERIAQLEKAEENKAKEQDHRDEAKVASKKDDDDETPTRKSYHKVRSGDTLYSIAKRYDVSVKQLADWNDLKAKRGLKTGVKLVVYKEDQRAAKKSKKDDHEDVKVASKKQDDSPSKSFHKVRKGDTLYSVAKRYGVDVKDLAEWNDLKPKSSLKAGVKLAILKADDKEDRRAKNDDEPKVAKKSKKDKDNNDDDVKVAKKGKNKAKDDDDDKRVAKNKERVKRISYEVKRGDTLYSISQRYNVSVSQIKTWNKATKNLKPGQDLVLYLAKS